MRFTVLMLTWFLIGNLVEIVVAQITPNCQITKRRNPL